MPAILPHLIVSLVYALLAWHFWRTRWHSATPAQPSFHTTQWDWAQFAILPALLIHMALLSQSIFAHNGINLNFGNSLSAILCLALAIYWIGSLFRPLEGLQTPVLSAAAVCAVLPALFPAPHTVANTGLSAFKIHLLIAILSYSLFTIAALLALLMAVVEKRLHGGTLPSPLQNLPPLLTLEKLLFYILDIAFVLLTLTLISGVFFSEELFNKPMQFNHKTVFGISSWIIFLALLAGRRIYGWRGRIAVRWTLAGFVTLLLAYAGSKFVLEVLLHR